MWRFLKLAGIAVAVWLALGIIVGQFDSARTGESYVEQLKSYGVSTPKAEYVAKQYAQLIDSLEHEGELSDFLDSVEGSSPQQAFGLGRYLGFSGLSRLGGERVRHFAAFETELWNLASTAQCAKTAQGQASGESALRLIARPDSPLINNGFDLISAGLTAELREQTPRPSYSQSRIEAAWSAFAAQLPPEERQRFATAIQTPDSTLSAEELCWTEKTLWRVLKDIPVEHAEVVYAQMAATAVERFGEQSR